MVSVLWVLKGTRNRQCDLFLFLSLICTRCGSVYAGYRCPLPDCSVLTYTWGKLQKHMAKHPGTRAGIRVERVCLLLLSSTQQPSRVGCARRCSRKRICCVGTSGSMRPKSLCWFAPGKTARPTSLQRLTCSTTSARCTSIFSNTNAPSRTVHACLPCG